MYYKQPEDITTVAIDFITSFSRSHALERGYWLYRYTQMQVGGGEGGNPNRK